MDSSINDFVKIVRMHSLQNSCLQEISTTSEAAILSTQDMHSGILTSVIFLIVATDEDSATTTESPNVAWTVALTAIFVRDFLASLLIADFPDVA